jgi:hypothetical protein
MASDWQPFKNKTLPKSDIPSYTRKNDQLARFHLPQPIQSNIPSFPHVILEVTIDTYPKRNYKIRWKGIIKSLYTLQERSINDIQPSDSIIGVIFLLLSGPPLSRMHARPPMKQPAQCNIYVSLSALALGSLASFRRGGLVWC